MSVRDCIELIKAKKLLESSEVIAFPTETVMGLGAYFDDEKAYKKLNEVKQRTPDKPYSLMIKSIDDICLYAKIGDDAKKVVDKFLPGPLTILLPAKDSLPEWCQKDGVVGIRVPKYGITNKLLNKVQKPLLAPSANKSGNTPGMCNRCVEKEFGSELKLIIKGKAGGEKPSTIFDMSKKPYQVIREGIITEKEIFEVING